MTKQEQFERWASVDGSVPRNTEKRDNGLYKERGVQDAWKGWQACAALTDAEILPLKLVGKVALDRIAELGAKEAQLRALLDTYNLGGWTDAERIISERDALAAQNEALREALKEMLRNPGGDYTDEVAEEVLATTNHGAEILRRRDVTVATKALDLVEQHWCRQDILKELETVRTCPHCGGVPGTGGIMCCDLDW